MTKPQKALPDDCGDGGRQAFVDAFSSGRFELFNLLPDIFYRCDFKRILLYVAAA